MNKHLLHILLCAATLTAGAITPAELRALIDAGERITLIDLRPQAAYEAGTLPDAMRMTARDAEQKPLKGRVVFFDDGTGPNLARRAVERLTAKNTAVQADLLEGGYAAWCDANGPTTERTGLKPVLARYVSYQDLTGKLSDDADDIVLLDLRPVAAAPRSAATATGDGQAQQPAPLPPPLNLAEELPGFAVTRELPSATPPRQALGAATATTGSRPSPLYILIDNGDGSAEKTARHLKESGISRVAVLAGGETIIRRKGEPGLIRRGPGAGLANETPPRSSAFATVIDEEGQQ